MPAEVLDAERIEEIFADGVDLSDPFIVLSLANISVERLRHADTSGLNDEERRYFNQGVEALRNQADAAAVNAASELDQAGHEREQGYFSSAAWMRHHLQVSNTEARARMQVARLCDTLPAWERAARNGVVGVEQLRAAARTFARSGVREAFIEHADDLLDDAIEQPFERFEELLANLRRLADPDTEARAAAHRHEARWLSMRQHADGTWRLSGRFGDTQGAEINDILAHHTDAEWRIDWQTTTDQHGPDAHIDQLPRTQAQRRADALHHMATTATTTRTGQVVPTLNVLIDWETFTTEATGGTHQPARYRTMVCRTQNGDPLPISEATSMALYAHLRRVVLDGAGTVIDLGRRRRLFTGAARDAVMLTHTTCIWHGCNRPVRRCHADHHVEWMRHHGRSSPHNGGPLCDAHNHLKHRHRYHIHRQPGGGYLITDPDGTPLP